MFRTREHEAGRRAQSLLSSPFEPDVGQSAASRLALALAKARAERAALELRAKQAKRPAYEPTSRTPPPVRARPEYEAELDDIAALARREAAVVARRIVEEAAHSHQVALEEIRAGLREIRDAIRDLEHARIRRRYF